MKITVERDGFVEAITAAVHAAGKANTIPILNNVLLRPNGATLMVAGTCMDLQAAASVAAEISNDGDENEITVQGKALSDVVNRLPKGAQILIEWGGEEKHGVTVKSGRSRYKIHTLPAAEFPSLLQPESPIRFALTGKDLARALNAVRFAISKETTRAYFCGVLMEVSSELHSALPSGERLMFVACNGVDLAVAPMSVPSGAEKMPRIIIPDATVPELIRLAAEADSEQVQLAIAANLLSASTRDKEFVTKLIDAEFPGYLRVIPAGPTRRMVVDCDQLSEALARLVSIGDGMRTRFDLDGGRLTITLANHEVGNAEEELEVEWEGDPLNIGLKAKALIAILDSMQADQCRIEFEDAMSPALIRPWRNGASDTSRVYATMPVA